jgi:Tol biopolymer transport system component
VIPASGGTPRWLTVETEQVFHGQPEWAPDGSQLVLNAFDMEATSTNVVTVSWPEGAWRQLTTDDGFALGARWLPGGQEVVYVHSTASVSLRLVDLSGILRQE